MIERYRLGTPIHTGAILDHKMAEIPSVSLLSGWEIEEESGTITKPLSSSTVVYGLGETVRGMNKRGWLYTSNNTDDPNHTEDKHSLYASQNFLLLTAPEEKRAEGIFIDDPGTVHFDIGYTRLNLLSIRSVSKSADIYRITAETAEEVIRAFRSITGESYIPPKWAFGFGQSRWGYKTEEDIRQVYTRYKEASVPIDSIYMDIDYMERYKDFTVDNTRFPNFSSFVQEMQERIFTLSQSSMPV